MARARRRFLECHPKLTHPSALPGFAVWRLEPVDIDMLGGPDFASDLSGATILTNLRDADELITAEAELTERLNADHVDLLRRLVENADYASGFWRATGVDPEGVDLRAGDRAARIVLPRRATNPPELLAALKERADEVDVV